MSDTDAGLKNGLLARRPAATPVYRRIEGDLRRRIAEGDWPAGAMLPGRAALAAEYRVDLRTLQRAIASLLDDGTLQASHRRGTFVPADPRPAAPVDVVTAAPAAPASPATRPTLGVVAALGPGRRADAADWVGVILSSLEREYAAAGGSVRVYNRIGREAEPLRAGVDQLLADGAGAIVVVGIHDDRALAAEAALALAGGGPDAVPAVFISWNRPPLNLAGVYYDNEVAGYLAAEHLLRAGYRRIVFFAPADADWITERWKGTKHALSAAPKSGADLAAFRDPTRRDQPFPGMSVDQEVLACAAARAFWQGEAGKPDAEMPAVICANDRVAYGFRQAAADAGRVMGRDYALVGFDDDPPSRLIGLTTLRPPLEALGEEAARLLLRALAGDRTSLQVRLRSHLMPRLSTAGIAAPLVADAA